MPLSSSSSRILLSVSRSPLGTGFPSSRRTTTRNPRQTTQPLGERRLRNRQRDNGGVIRPSANSPSQLALTTVSRTDVEAGIGRVKGADYRLQQIRHFSNRRDNANTQPARPAPPARRAPGSFSSVDANAGCRRTLARTLRHEPSADLSGAAFTQRRASSPSSSVICIDSAVRIAQASAARPNGRAEPAPRVA